MSIRLTDFTTYVAAEALMGLPLVSIGLTILIPVLIILLLDYLNYQRQRKRLGNVAIVGDAPYLWRRLRWTENEVNLRGVLQRGYQSVGRIVIRWDSWLMGDSSARSLNPSLTGASTTTLSL